MDDYCSGGASSGGGGGQFLKGDIITGAAAAEGQCLAPLKKVNFNFKYNSVTLPVDQGTGIMLFPGAPRERCRKLFTQLPAEAGN